MNEHPPIEHREITEMPDSPESLTRLARLETKQDHQTAILERVERMVIGSDDRPGIITRLDRLEQTDGRHRRVIGWVGAGAASALVASVWGVLKGGGPHQ